MIDEKTLAELKEALTKEKEELERGLNSIAKPVDEKKGDYETSFDDIGRDEDENATETEEYTDNLPVEITLEKRLQEVLAALKRIENGTYGNCQNCGQEIDIERLKANPAATTCIKCN